MHYRLLSLIMVAIIAFGIGGCGGGDGSTSADPLETDSLIFGYNDPQTDLWYTTMPADRHGTIILTAKVNNASGEPVINRRVSFDFAANGSGAVLSAYSAYTNSAGEASIIYTAGMADGFDIVKAKISNGSSMVANISVADPLGTDSLTLTSDATQVDYRGTVMLTATVIDASGVGVVGREVSFEFLSNQSGATLSSSIVKTGFGGVASVIYTAGMANGFDVVRATISNGSSMIANITVASAVSTSGITVAGAPTTLDTNGSNSIITATVINSAGAAVSGVRVNFVVSGAGGTLSVASATTDGSGNAVTTFTGNGVSATGATSVVTASITISGNTYTDAAVITYP